MTFTEFLKKVDDTFISHQAARSKSTDNSVSISNQLRYGQTIMNILHDVWHTKYLEITDSDMDCFYTNRNVSILLNKLEKEWYEPNSKR
jgi:hypothetical protein